MIIVYILKKIKVILLLHRHNRHGLGNINLEIDDNSINYININYIDKNNEDIEKNKNNISTNIINISGNEDNIASNLNEINYLKKNKPTQYLKNLDNLIFRCYNYTTSYNKDIPFYNKSFNFSFKKNDFIELYIKVLLNYTNIDDRIYLKSIYQIKNNDTILYTNIINHNKYEYFDNHLTINETIFYTFNEDINNLSFLFKFETIKNDISDIKYIFNNNNRLIFKHYSN